jgi:hypothetical protein
VNALAEVTSKLGLDALVDSGVLCPGTSLRENRLMARLLLSGFLQCCAGKHNVNVPQTQFVAAIYQKSVIWRATMIAVFRLVWCRPKGGVILATSA